MLDVLSGGRLVAGFPVGTSMDTNFCYGEAPATLREKYLEAHDLIIKAWTAKDDLRFNGKFTQLRYVNLWPQPLQQPHPPIWIPGGGSIETWDFCANHDYQYSSSLYSRLSRTAAGHRRLLGDRDGDKEQGAQSLQPGLCPVVAVAETDEQAERDLRARTWTISTTAACTCISRLRRRARLSHARHDQVRACSARSDGRPHYAARLKLEGLRRRAATSLPDRRRPCATG